MPPPHPTKSCRPPADPPIKVGQLLLVGADKADGGEEGGEQHFKTMNTGLELILVGNPLKPLT